MKIAFKKILLILFVFICTATGFSQFGGGNNYVISGSSSVYDGSTHNYSLNHGSSIVSATWGISSTYGNIISSTNTTASISFISSGTTSVSAFIQDNLGNIHYVTKSVTVQAGLSAGTISADQTICYNGNPANLSSVSLASGGPGGYVYQWQYSAGGGTGTNWFNISGATSTSYNPPGGLTSARWYRRKVTSGSFVKYTNDVRVLVNSPVTAGSINGTQTICYGGDPNTLGNAASPTNGVGGYSYQWQYSNNGSGGWGNISGATSSSYNPPNGLTSNRWYRRRVVTCGQTKYTGGIKVTVRPALVAGSIGGAQTICSGEDPVLLTSGSLPSGGNGSYSYQWQYSNNGSSGWTDIANATSTSYDPISLVTSRWYRRNAISCGQILSSNSIKVTTTSQPTWYADADGDGFGEVGSTTTACTQPAGYVANSTDACPGEFGTDNGCPNLLAKLSNENSFASRIYQKELNDSTEITAVGDVIENVTYYDGLGRPLQQVAIRASKEQGDLVTHIGYDAYGRVDREWLPLYRQANEAFGSFRHGMAGAAQTYYKNSYASDFTGLSVPNINAYSQKEFEPSPLNRVLKQAAPGEDWKMGSGHEIVFGYDTNDTDEVRFFKVSTSFTNGIYEPILVQSGYYAVGELYKNVTKDENHDGTSSKLHTTESYTDKLGHVVLKRTYGEVGSPSAVEAHDTHYVYDGYGNLTYVLPPKVDTSNGVSATELNELCYQYKYDHRNRLVEKKIPGKGWEHIVYNKLDQPVMVQDAVQRTDNEWSYTKYDAFGRVAYTGIADLVATRSQAQANVDGAAAQFEERDGPVYTTNTYPSIYAVPNVLHTMNYYDAYDFDLQGYTIPTTVLGQTVSQNVRGLPTGGGVLVLDGNGDKWVSWARGYDEKGRVITEGTLNDYLQTFTQVETKLDFVGRPEQVVTTHSKGANPPIVTTDDYAYDHMGRLTQQTRTIGAHTETIVENTYGELGQLVGKKVGGNLQTVDYEYNVRGWLRAINNTANLGNDLFAFDINYNTADHGGTPLYNGNISETEWKTANVDNGLKWYRYVYDPLNRIIAAADNTGNYDLSNVTYDKNGNIQSLTRNGYQGSSTFTNMDVLDYDYDNGNKLLKVSDTGNGAHGFKDGTNTNDDFEYDINGNLEVDRNKGITSITYNHLDLPEKVDFGSDNIKYVYDATGAKLKRTSSSGTETLYANGYIYEGGIGIAELQFFNHPEGYVTPDGQGGYDYVYNYVDHLGSVRLSYTDADNDGSIDPANEIIEDNAYYPFGLLLRSATTSISPYGNSAAKRWKYNGKELDNTFNIDTYDYGARNYDPTIGRWMNIDPLAENSISMTQYHYAANNPIVFIDPDGQDWFYYKAEGDDEARYHWQEGSEYEHTYSYTDDNGDQQTGTIGLTGISSFVGEDQNGDFFNFGDDGKVSSIDASSIGEGTDIVNVRSMWETVPGSEENSSRSSEGVAAQLGTAVVFSQGDSPAPGPGDVLALGVLYNLLHGLITGDGVESSMQTLHFSKRARGRHGETEFEGVDDDVIATELAGLNGSKLTKEQKARKRKLQKEQKIRTQRNKQKKGSEKGTGTGRRQ